MATFDDRHLRRLNERQGARKNKPPRAPKTKKMLHRLIRSIGVAFSSPSTALEGLRVVVLFYYEPAEIEPVPTITTKSIGKRLYNVCDE